MTRRHIPEGLYAITPYVIVADAAAAIEFYQKVFGATEIMRHAGPDGRVAHAKLKLGDAPFEIGEHRDVAVVDAQRLPPVSMHLYVEEVDAVCKRAVAAGATMRYAVTDQDYGDREGGVIDPFGVSWWVATHKGAA